VPWGADLAQVEAGLRTLVDLIKQNQSD